MGATCEPSEPASEIRVLSSLSPSRPVEVSLSLLSLLSFGELDELERAEVADLGVCGCGELRETILSKLVDDEDTDNAFSNPRSSNCFGLSSFTLTSDVARSGTFL